MVNTQNLNHENTQIYDHFEYVHLSSQPKIPPFLLITTGYLIEISNAKPWMLIMCFERFKN